MSQTANYLRRSRVSENKNRRQSIRRSIRRGGAPPQAPPPPPLPARAPAPLANPKLGRDGSLCLGLTSKETCVPNAAMQKICQWMPNAKPVPRCQRKANTSNLSSEGKKHLSDIEARRAQALRDVYSSDDEPEESDASSQQSEDEDVAAPPAPVRAAAVRAPAPRAAARAQAVRAPAPRAPAARVAAPRAANRVPFLNPNKPLGCAQRVSQVNTKRGTSYTRTACYDSKDPAVNDAENCFINPATNKCKKVVRD